MIETALPPELDRYVDSLGALLSGPANVVMQLCDPAVGYGVLESKVPSGQVMRHPLKRFRTTYSYLAVAMLGTDEDRRAFREAVNRVHRLVRSDAASPVPYDAFDPDLQLWVAACLYQGAVDVDRMLHGPVTEHVADEFYAYAARFGTTLQVRLWPPDRAAFARYWDSQLARISVDAPVRDYLERLVLLRFLPWPFRRLGPLCAWVTTGFLPAPFRDAVGWPWTPRDEARFRRMVRAVSAVSRRLPRPARRALLTVCLRDVRRRVRRGRALV